jgi:hypothetical protein
MVTPSGARTTSALYFGCCANAGATVATSNIVAPMLAATRCKYTDVMV